jgi:hypothetical protein
MSDTMKRRNAKQRRAYYRTAARTSSRKERRKRQFYDVQQQIAVRDFMQLLRTEVEQTRGT